MASGSVQLYLYTSGKQPREILARTPIMDSQQWRVYLVSPNWELFPTQYAFFGAIVDDVDLRVDYCHHTFPAAYIELIRKWQRVFRVIDGVRDFRIVQQKDAGTAAAKQTPTPSITRNRIRHRRHAYAAGAIFGVPFAPMEGQPAPILCPAWEMNCTMGDLP